MATDFTTPVNPTPEQSPNLIDVFTQTGDAVLASIVQSQELLLDVATKAAANAPQAPQVSVPYTGAPGVNVPSPKELADVSFAFADKWLANQKAFAAKYLALSHV